jgi:2-C-methyl-D-erythritol 4-phosphate cytidylyltransferase
MGAGLPKQYLPLFGRPIIAHSLAPFCEHRGIEGIVVALAADDRHWEGLGMNALAKVRVTVGGAERCHSVLAALRHLADDARPEDWVLVHDAARPCLRRADLDRLIAEGARHPVGALLGLPVRDTMKRSDAHGQVVETVPRRGLWHALTPQMFRLGMLTEALAEAIAEGVVVTDEAEAMERSGRHPLLVEGHADNLKITRPDDLLLAEAVLQYRERQACA